MVWYIFRFFKMPFNYARRRHLMSSLITTWILGPAMFLLLDPAKLGKQVIILTASVRTINSSKCTFIGASIVPWIIQTNFVAREIVARFEGRPRPNGRSGGASERSYLRLNLHCITCFKSVTHQWVGLLRRFRVQRAPKIHTVSAVRVF